MSEVTKQQNIEQPSWQLVCIRFDMTAAILSHYSLDYSWLGFFLQFPSKRQSDWCVQFSSRISLRDVSKHTGALKIFPTCTDTWAPLSHPKDPSSWPKLQRSNWPYCHQGSQSTLPSVSLSIHRTLDPSVSLQPQGQSTKVGVFLEQEKRH